MCILRKIFTKKEVMLFFSSGYVPFKWRNDAEEWLFFAVELRLMIPFFILRMTGQWIWSIGGMVTDKDKPKFKEKSFFFFFFLSFLSFLFFLFLLSSFFWCGSPCRSLACSVVHLQISLFSSGLLHPLTFISNEDSLVVLPSHLRRDLPQVVFHGILYSVVFSVFWNYPFRLYNVPIVIFFNLMYFNVTGPSNNSYSSSFCLSLHSESFWQTGPKIRRSQILLAFLLMTESLSILCSISIVLVGLESNIFWVYLLYVQVWFCNG